MSILVQVLACFGQVLMQALAGLFFVILWTGLDSLVQVISFPLLSFNEI